MKRLENLTEEEFDILKSNDILKSLYPEAPNNFKEVENKRPVPNSNPNFQPLIDICEQYLDSLEHNTRIKDIDYYMFETAIECVYGNQHIWNYINSF